VCLLQEFEKAAKANHDMEKQLQQLQKMFAEQEAAVAYQEVRCALQLRHSSCQPVDATWL
jgi:hypothetical protein